MPASPKLVANFIINVVMPWHERKAVAYENIPVSAFDLAMICNRIFDETISFNSGKRLFYILCEEGKNKCQNQ